MSDSSTYIHTKSISFLAKFLQGLMAVVGVKNKLEKQMRTGKFSHTASPIPKSFRTHYDVKITEVNERKTWTIKPKQNGTEKVILFLHGGAYINNILKFHWHFIDQLISKTKATIVIPDYPLAPKNSAMEAYQFVDDIYNQLLVNVLSKDFILLGDSAGGGLAFGFAQKLRNENRVQPSQIILLSPWLDITMSNPDILLLNQKDKMLGVKGLQLAGSAFAAKLDAKDFRVSPIYGNFKGLGKIVIFIGTHDVLYADSVKLKNVLKKEDIPVKYFEYPKMFHDWVLMTRLKESKQAINQISGLVNYRGKEA